MRYLLDLVRAVADRIIKIEHAWTTLLALIIINTFRAFRVCSIGLKNR